MDRLYAEIGRRMRGARLALRRTQAQVAEVAGIDPSFYGQIERGANIPSLKTFCAIARALGVEPGDLLCDRRPAGRLYEKALESLLRGLGPGHRRLVLGVVSDMVERLERR